jgi:heme-degrading monooxygenase HmoA
MAELVTTGTWQVPPAREAAFIEAWTQFAEWASAMPGSTTLRLGRDLGQPGRFVSFAAWQDAATVWAWKHAPDFRERLAQVVQHVEAFHPTELDVVATAHGLAAHRTR